MFFKVIPYIYLFKIRKNDLFLIQNGNDPTYFTRLLLMPIMIIDGANIGGFYHGL